MKTVRKGLTTFKCDQCHSVAGVAQVESVALQIARRVAHRDGWEWQHPHWGLRCPSCKEE